MVETGNLELLNEWFSEPSRLHDGSEELSAILMALFDGTELDERCDAWLALVEWTRAGTSRIDKGLYSHSHTRLEKLLDLIEQHPIIRHRLQTSVAALIEQTKGISLYADSGISSGRGFVSEITERLLTKILPSPRDDHELAKILSRQYKTEAHLDRLKNLTPELFHRLSQAIVPDDLWHRLKNLHSAYADAFRLLSLRIQAEGLSKQLLLRSPHLAIERSPFYQLTIVSDQVMEACQTSTELDQRIAAWKLVAQGCRQICGEINQRLEKEGVNLDIVTGLDIIDHSLTRMEKMIEVLRLPSGKERSQAVHVLMVELLQGIYNDRSVRFYLSNSTSLLQRKIVDRAGETGEHYVTHTKAEYRLVLWAAAGGGLLTTITAAVKIHIHDWHSPLFINGLASSLNYAISFLLMQAFGLILATKQPAMTAAYLASIIREKKGEDRLESISAFTASIVRGQLAAVTGNIILVAIGVYLFNLLWQLLTGQNYVGQGEAHHIFETLSPLNSGTFFYAALTGVLLWLGSVVGGWLENLLVYYRAAEGIRDLPIRHWIGKERLRELSIVFRKNTAGITTNISLGFLLGMTPTVGEFLGLPLEVRHVTLSTGQLALAAASLNEDWWKDQLLIPAFLGIASMFVLNLSVSFSLSLLTATRAYKLSFGEILNVFGFVGRDFVRRPYLFLLPPKE